ncbi:MAG: CheY-like chemotaxis protein, partial [Rickettsiales bacterium]
GLIFKNFKKFKTIPIIAFSANSDEISKNIASQSGMNDYLEKPFDQEKFSNILLKLTFN